MHYTPSIHRRLPYREKDESHIVISIDFKADLIDLFEGNKKTARKLRGSKFDKGIPKQSNVETFNHFLKENSLAREREK